MEVFGKLNNLFNSYVSKNVKIKASKDFFESCSVYGYDLKDHAETLYNKGMAYLAESDYEQATEQFFKSLKIIPDNSKVKLAIGITSLGLKKYDDAVFEFTEIIEKDPDFIDAKLFLAEAYLKLGKFNSAIKELTNVQQNYKNDAEIEKKLLNAYFQYGNKLRKVKDYKNAISKYKSAARYDSKNARLYHALGLCYKDLMIDQEAIDYFELALNYTKDAKKSASYQQIAEIFERKKEFSKANDFYNKALEYETSTHLKHFYKGKIFFNKKYYDSAIKSFNTAVEISDNFLKGLFSLAETYEIINDYEKAVLIYYEILSLEKDNSSAHINIAVNNYKQGKKEEAFQKLSVIVPEIGADNALAHKYIGLILMERGNTDEALLKFKRAETLDPLDSEVYLYQSICLKKQKNIKPAIEAARKSMDIEPNKPEVLKNLAQLYFENANTNKSIELFEMLLKLTPNDHEIYLALGRIYQRNAEFQKAIHFYKKYLHNTSDGPASLNLAISYFEINKFTDALNIFESLKDKDRELSITSYYYLSKIYQKQAKLIKALESIESCLKIDVKYIDGLLQAGKIYLELFEYEKAIEAINKALVLDPENTAAQVQLKDAKEKYKERYGQSY
jgi:tetratricopeptide (TPR) repeat protein